MHETCCKTYWIGAINTKVCATKSRCNFSQRTHLIHPHCTQNSYFGVFYSVWVHLGSLRICMKLGAKWGELVQLMQKFVPWSNIGIFHNDCTQSTPLDIRSILVHLGSFRNCMKLGAKRGELEQLMQKFVPQNHVGIFRNERTKPTPLDPKLMIRSVLLYFGAFGIIS